MSLLPLLLSLLSVPYFLFKYSDLKPTTKSFGRNIS